MQPPLARVIVVEDREDDAYILSRLFEKAAPSVAPQLFSSGEEALAYLADLGVQPSAMLPTAAFIDISLPGVNGYDLVKWLRQHDTLHSTVAVLLSSAEEPRNLGKAAQLGADGYVVKFPSVSGMRDLLAAIPPCASALRPRPVLAVSCNLLFGGAAE